MSTEQTSTKTTTTVAYPDRFNVIIFNDDFTPMDFVIQLLIEIFNRNLDEAKDITLTIHEKGQAIAGTYMHELAEQKLSEAIMATRTISSWKERLITILVVPFTTCSARLPVYAILISLIIPNTKIFGFYNLQAFTLLMLYALGFVTAILAAYILQKTLKIKSNSFFVVEMPNYKLPSIKNVAFDVLEKTKAFVFGAGKIILALSVVLWFLASNGPKSYKNAAENVTNNIENSQLSATELQQKIGSVKLENSYIGIMGKSIEPAIKPLGYDWKVGIALITSFAAREVFVGTLATIYSVEADNENTTTIKEKMRSEINPETGKQRFNFPAGMSLLVFYAFAMQCMATLAIVKRETKTWKWPLIQLFGMTGLAYICSLIVYQILS